MAVYIITPTTPFTPQLTDNSLNPTLIVMAGGYIVASGSGVSAYKATGGGARVTVNGLLSAEDTGALSLGQSESATLGGGNNVTVGATGQLFGKSGVSAFGGNNIINNAGQIAGSVLAGEAGGTASNAPAGVYLRGAANNVVNTGGISGFYGIVSDGPSLKIDNNGTITGIRSYAILTNSLRLSNAGTIQGDIFDFSGDDTLSLTNSGLIAGNVINSSTTVSTILNFGTITGNTLNSSADTNLDNFGTMQRITAQGGTVVNHAGARMGPLVFGSAVDAIANSIRNDGELQSFSSGGRVDLFTNTGTIVNSVLLGDGANFLDNSGAIGGLVVAGLATDVVQNAGTITAVNLGEGVDTLANSASGVIRRQVILGGNSDVSADSFVNNGTVGADLELSVPTTVTFGDGADTLANYGTIFGGVDMGAGLFVDTLTNAGAITGSVFMGNGNDIVDDALGRIDGFVNLGSGNDTFSGGASDERVRGDIGNDVVDLFGGDDSYAASNGDGNDIVDGGDGVDTYNASACSSSFHISLEDGITSVTVGVDSVLNFENVIGGAGTDIITGSSGANRIDGGNSGDTIVGLSGNDRLIGGLGTDSINGGAGRDVMTGGSVAGSVESDTFMFANGDSGATTTTRDVITDFTDHGAAVAPFATGADILDLSSIDADPTLAGDQAFTFNALSGASFSGAAGSLVWAQKVGFALVSGDVNGDKVVDFAIQLTGTHTLFASDFIL